MLDKQIVDFLGNHRISVLTTLLPNGTPHSSTIHYASSLDPLYFIFFTQKSSRKCSHFDFGKKYSASLVIGFSEEEWTTMQFEGEVEWVTSNTELDKNWGIYSSKYNGSEKYKSSQEDILLKFTPTWWRYTKLKPKPAVIISSQP